jgi:hypothetical protein
MSLFSAGPISLDSTFKSVSSAGMKLMFKCQGTAIVMLFEKVKRGHVKIGVQNKSMLLL